MAAAIPKGRVDLLTQYWEPTLRRAFLQAMQNVRNRAQIDQIVRFLEQNRVESAIEAVGLDPVSLRPYDRTFGQMFEAGGEFAARSVPAIVGTDGLRTVFQFNVRNPDAEQWLLQYSSDAVQGILEDQRQMIRETLVQGLERGANPRSTALQLVGRVVNGQRQGGLLGLTANQASWVRNYAIELAGEDPAALERGLRDRRFDSLVRRAIDGETQLTADQIETMVQSYTNRMLKFRADTVARTETLRGLHVVQDISIQQAVDSGLNPGAVGFIWRATHDNRTRESHREMDGQRRALGESFETPDGELLRYPGDPLGPPEETINCRCWREPYIDFLAGVE